MIPSQTATLLAGIALKNLFHADHKALGFSRAEAKRSPGNGVAFIQHIINAGKEVGLFAEAISARPIDYSVRRHLGASS